MGVYPSTTEVSVGSKTVKLALTGTAMRTKLIVNVYAIGSYVQEGVKVRTAEDLARRWRRAIRST